MTTKPADQEAVELKDAREPGTLASKLESPHPVFAGHPANDAPFGEPEDAAPPEGAEGAEPPEDAAPPEGAEGAKPPAAPPEPPARKFKSWEEAEKAENEHQRLARTAAEEAANLRKENEELKKKLEPAPEAAPAKERPAVKTQEEVEAEATGRIETALEEIGQLDEFSPTYKKDVAKAWAKAGFGGGGQATIPDIDTIVDERVDKALSAREAKTEEVNVRQRANGFARDAGLDMTEDSLDYVAFWHYAKQAPEAPFTEQVQWTIDEVNRRKGVPPAATPAEKERAKQEQILNAPLEKGGASPPATPPAAQTRRSLNSIIEEGKSARII